MKNDVIKLYKNGFKIKEIAEKYKCERHKISRILKNNNIKTSRHEKLKDKIFHNKSDDDFIVIEDFIENKRGMCKIRFIDTGYETICHKGNIKKGSVKDYYKKTIYDVACKGHIVCKKGSFEQICFHRWCAMLSRCYNKKDINYKAYGEQGVRVCEKWLIFENFYNDLCDIKGFDRDLYIGHKIELDKDKNGFQKEYNLKNCQFLTIQDNRKYQRKNIKPFKAISPNGDVYVYETQMDCARELNLTARTIGKCLHKQLKHHHGYSFEYLEPQTTIPNGSSE